MKRTLKVLFVVIALVAAIGAMSGCFVRTQPVQAAPVYVARPAGPPPPTVVYTQPAPAPAPVYVAPQPSGPPPPTIVY
jgi:hypothetical protein